MTIILISKTALFAWGISIPVGIYSAVRQHSIEDYSITFIGFMGLPEWKLILKYPVCLALNQLVSTLG